MIIDLNRIYCECYSIGKYDNEPCWGDLKFIEQVNTEEGRILVYICRGHRDTFCTTKYYSKPT
jgi:hypothetical protein